MRINIVREDGTVRFEDDDGNTISLDEPGMASFGGMVFWRNLDPSAQHWIRGFGEPEGARFPFPLAEFVDGQPADTTPDMELDAMGRFDFECSLHPGETGTINIT